MVVLTIPGSYNRHNYIQNIANILKIQKRNVLKFYSDVVLTVRVYSRNENKINFEGFIKSIQSVLSGKVINHSRQVIAIVIQQITDRHERLEIEVDGL